MLVPFYRTKFSKDIKLAKKRGKNLLKLKQVMLMLGNGETLPKNFRDHHLSGKFSFHRECHIEPEWLLIYHIEGNEIIFERTGTHADLFKM